MSEIPSEVRRTVALPLLASLWHCLQAPRSLTDHPHHRLPLLKKLGVSLAALLGLFLLSGAVLVSGNWAAFGKRADGERLARMRRSPQWDEGAFENPQPLWDDFSISKVADAVLDGSEYGSPENPGRDIPVVRGDGSVFEEPPATGLRVTWFGHSSMLIEIDGTRVLTDPVWGPSPSPITWVGPQRWYEPPLALESLPAVDAVLISHDHPDHLDYATFEVIKNWDSTFFVPLGVGAHLEYWGVPADRIVELDWWERGAIDGLQLVCTPARHASGRGVLDRNSTLWASWALLGPEHRVFYSGDTGLFDGLKKIGAELGPFDLTVIDAGAYHALWPDWHPGPEQAVLAHQWLRGEFFLPVHWGLFDLAFHGWTEPIERALIAAERAGVQMVLPRPGQSVEPESATPFERWWPDVPWQTAEEHPVISTATNGRPPG